jgi:serine-type D-Ala-D-Ala carboxypeptidase
MRSGAYGRAGRSLVSPLPRVAKRQRPNDGNAHHAFGGVAGHAGLFFTANDLAAFGAALAAGGIADGTRIWQTATIDLFTAEHRDPGQGLGFWTRRLTGTGDRRDGGFGHGGFPGTELLIHPPDISSWCC